MHILLVANSNSLRDLLSETLEVRVMGEPTNREDTIALTRQLQPDLLLVNFQLLGGSGLETPRIFKDFPSPPLLVILTDNIGPEYQASCLSAETDNVFDKAIDIETIQALVRDLIR